MCHCKCPFDRHGGGGGYVCELRAILIDGGGGGGGGLERRSEKEGWKGCGQCQRGGQKHRSECFPIRCFSFSVSGPDTDTMILFNDAWTPVLRTDDWLVLCHSGVFYIQYH